MKKSGMSFVVTMLEVVKLRTWLAGSFFTGAKI